MTPPQGALSIERMCALTGVSRASYYRHWRQVAPRREETELRDRLQRVAITHRHYGYRRLTELLRRAGWAVNHKRVLRLMRTDNLLCLRRPAFVPATTIGRSIRTGSRSIASIHSASPSSLPAYFAR